MAGEQCNRCRTSNTKFKFFNNKKPDQPRYQCLDCTSVNGKPYFFNSNPKRQHHKDGYAKLPKEETEELKNLEKVCDKCQAVNNVKFRGYNNGNMNQPRYVCRGCNKLFSPLKKSRAVVRAAVDTTEPSNQFQTQPATTSEALDQQQIPLQHQIAYGFQLPHFQTPVQNHNTYQGTLMQQQIALENQQPPFQAQSHFYHPPPPYHPNPMPSSQQQIPTGIPLSHYTPSFQNNQQPQFAPQFQQQQHQHPPLIHNNQWNQSNFPQQQFQTGIQQPHYYPSFQNDLRHRPTMIQQQQQQLHHQSRIPPNYPSNPQGPLAQQQIPTGNQQRHPHPPLQYYCIGLIPSANQQPQFPPASQSNNNHPDTRNSEELGVRNEQDPPATASLPANRGGTTASPLTHQSITELVNVPEEFRVIYEDPYFKNMIKFVEKESIKF